MNGDNVVHFPRKPKNRLPEVANQTQPDVVEQLSEEILKWAVDHHAKGVLGVDIYRAMIMASCKLIVRADDDPAIIDRRLKASHQHMLEAHEILKARDYKEPFPGPTKAS
jgi:hypothetical protein